MAETFPRSFRLTEDERDTLEALARDRFNGSQTAAVRACLAIGARVYGAALRPDEMAPDAALAAYCRQANGGRP